MHGYKWPINCSRPDRSLSFRGVTFACPSSALPSHSSAQEAQEKAANMSDFERMLREAKLAEAGEQDKQQLQQGEEEGV